MTVLAFSFTNENGEYFFEKTISDTGEYSLEAKNINYQPCEIKIRISEQASNQYNAFYLMPLSKPMKDIVIKTVWKERENGDTIEYNASQYQTPQTRKVEDLLKNIDGFSISSEGKIMYRGKEVKAMLVNGDDLTQDQYTLLSKNLNSDVVDKIQVIDNYSNNRIIGSLVKSDEVAVNLKLKKKLFGRVSGSYSVGFAPVKKWDSDANAILLKNKLTVIQFLAANNVSKNIIGNSFFENETTSASVVLPMPIEKKLVFAFPVSGGNINAPPIPSDYILHNDVALASTLLNIRINKKIKVSGKIGWFKDHRTNFSQNNIKTIINGDTSWQINNREDLILNNSGVAATLNLSHDNAKNFVGNAGFQLLHLNRVNLFSSVTQIAIADSLMENIKSTVNLFSSNYSSATKINNTTALSFSLLYHRLPGETLLDAVTHRYAEHFNRGANLEYFNQQTGYIFSVTGSEIGLLHKKNKVSYKYSLKFQKEVLEGNNELKGREKSQPPQVLINSLKENNSQQQGQFNFSGSYSPFKKTTLKIDASVGSANLKVNSYAVKSPVWQAEINGTYKMKTFSYVSASLTSVKKLPSLQLFFLDSLLDGAAVIKYGASDVQPIQYNEANVSFSYFKFRTNTSLLANVWIRHSLRDYASRFFITPSLLQWRYIPVEDNVSKGVLLSGKTFIYPMRSTISFSSFLQHDIESKVLNELPAVERNLNLSYTISLITNFKIPINSEVSFNHFLYKGSQRREKQVLSASNNFFTIENKCRAQLSQKFYFGTQYNFLKLDSKSHHLASLFAGYSLTKKSSFDLKVHNLLNQTYFTRNSVTNNTSYFQTFLNVPRYFLVRFNHSF